MKDLRDFLDFLEKQGELKRITTPISPKLEVTEICHRLLRQGGPALVIENPQDDEKKWDIPMVVNLFGTTKRVAMGLSKNVENVQQTMRELGEMLAFLRQPKPPKGMRDAWENMPIFKRALAMREKEIKKAPCQEVVIKGDDIDLYQYPIQTCWPGEPAPLITWPMVVTRSGKGDVHNLGIYRMQVLNKKQTLMRWLHHRGGAEHHREWQKMYEKPLPVAAVIGADPACILAAVTPVPETLSEYQFSGLLRGSAIELVQCKTQPLLVPAHAEIIIEGEVSLQDYQDEGPYGDHTGYYNSVEKFPVFTVTAITQRKKPYYLSTHTGRPPDEPSVLGEALNDVFIPLIQQQFPEIQDFWLPPEACSYRIAVISIKKRYAGHARTVAMGAWSYLKQFMYTKWVIVVDDDINARDWKDVMWAISTRMDPARDTTIIENTPIDYLDFASPVSGLGSKICLDATNKFPGETTREWGKLIEMDDAVVKRVDKLWGDLGLT